MTSALKVLGHPRAALLSAMLALSFVCSCASSPVRSLDATEAQERALARFAAVVCDDLLREKDGELDRVDHLDTKGRVRVILPQVHHTAFRGALVDHYLGMTRIQLLDDASGEIRELREPYLTFFVERNDWGVWYRCVAKTERPASDGVYLSGYSDSWWVTDGGITFRMCFRHVR